MKILPYGDTLNDGMLQLSFTLPIPKNNKSIKVAEQFALNMNLTNISVVHQEDIGEDCTYFILYAKENRPIELDDIIVKEEEYWSKDKVEEYMVKNNILEITVVGACTGYDTHTVGIDAIFNMKGYDGHYGLERYKNFNAINLGSQVLNRDLIECAISNDAKAILVSQVVTEKNVHLHNLTELVDMLESMRLRDKIILVCGGPRISNELAKELGYDQGFSKGSFAEHVAKYIVTEIVRKNINVDINTNS